MHRTVGSLVLLVLLLQGSSCGHSCQLLLLLHESGRSLLLLLLLSVLLLLLVVMECLQVLVGLARLLLHVGVVGSFLGGLIDLLDVMGENSVRVLHDLYGRKYHFDQQ